MAKILIADDEPQVRSAMAGILKEGGHDFEEAYDGISALDYLKTYEPDLLLLDWWIPEIFGGEVLDKIRNDPEYEAFKKLPVIVVSDFADETSLQKFRQAGANDFVPKKEDLEEFKRLLLERIDLALK